MGLFSCFGLRSKSYNAKKYELSSDTKKETKKKNRRSTDSIGVADTNAYPQLIEETGGEVHSLKDIKETDENECQTNNNHNDCHHKGDGKHGSEDDCTGRQTEEHKPNHQQNNAEDNHHLGADHQQNHSNTGHSSADDHHGHSDHNTSSGDVTHHTSDHAMDISSPADTSNFSGGGDCGGGDSGGDGGGGGDSCGTD